MRIFALRTERTEGGVRIAADYAFEDATRPGGTVAFEVDESYAPALTPASDPFVVALTPLASWHGERRVLVEGRACGVLRSHLREHARVLASWYPRCREPAIEASAGFEAGRPVAPARVGLMLTGGVDSLAALRQNRLDVPADHPASIRDGLVVHGLSVRHAPGGRVDPARLRRHREHVDRLARFGAATGLTVISVRTSLLQAWDPQGWRDAGFGAGTVAAAHALSRRLSGSVMGSTGAGAWFGPHGHHPLLDDRLSSGALHAVPGLPYRTRHEKVGLLAAWPAALEVLHPCLLIEEPAPGRVNCGRCEKCLRTMLSLEAVGALSATPAFAGLLLTAEAVLRAPRANGLHVLYGDDLARDLDARARRDLADAVRVVMAKARMTRWQRRRARWSHSVAKRLGRLLPSRRAGA